MAASAQPRINATGRSDLLLSLDVASVGTLLPGVDGNPRAVTDVGLNHPGTSGGRHPRCAPNAGYVHGPNGCRRPVI